MARAPETIPDHVLRLLLARGLGAVTIARLLERFGSWEAAAGAPPCDLAGVEGIGPAAGASVRREIDAADPAAERALMAGAGAGRIIRGDEDYPVLLAAIPDPPAALWVRGALEPADCLAVAIVGARRCTAYGRDQAGRLAALLAECGLTVVSGGALGVDGEAHRGALRAGGRTIAVLGCGLDVCYPRRHADLFAGIVAAGGALLSEHPMRMEPRPGHFPHRNRIISGLSLGVLVIEAARRSGALITARRAAEEHGREVMAVPGRVDSPASAGCHAAIREGWAGLVTSHADVLSQLDSAGHLVRGALEAAGVAGATSRATLLDAGLTGAQQAIVAALAAGEVLRPEAVAAALGLPLGRVLADLTLLEIRGRVRREREGVRLARAGSGGHR